MRAAWWWIDRWRQSTAFMTLTAEEQGVLRNLWDELWLRPDHIIPDDQRILAKASGDHEAWARCSERVLRWMKRVDGGWTNLTALEVIEQSERRAKNQKAYRERINNRINNGPDNGADNKVASPSPSNVLTPLPPKGGGGGVASRTEQERLRLESDEKLRGIADYWSERFGRTGRQLGVLRAAKQAFAAGYEADTLRLVIRTAAACSQNPDRYPPRSSFRWAVDNSRLGPEYLLRPSTLDRLVPEGESWERE